MRIVTAITLAFALLTGACTTPDGRIDPGATLGLAAGLAAVGGLVYLATQNNGNSGHHGYHGGYNGGWGGGQRGRYAYR